MPLFHTTLVPEPERHFPGASLTTSYQAILNAAGQASPLSHSSTMLIMVNNTGVLVKVSWDGVNDHLTLVPGANFVMDENSNAVSMAEFKTAKSTQFWVKLPSGGSAGTDNLYFSTFYSQ